jgi:hemoglobin
MLSYTHRSESRLPCADHSRASAVGNNMIDELYELIGGRQAIAKATDIFYNNVLADPALRPFFAASDMRQLRSRQSMFISMLLGGRVVYTGKEMGAAHEAARAHGLTEAHFDRFLAHFRAALLEVGVSAIKAKKVIRLLDQKRDLVLRGANQKKSTPPPPA